jgi:molybdenum cofactor cytidylyltransferase
VRVAGLLLAAGAGRRFGGPKALARLGAETLVERGIRLLADGGCDPVVVVVGARADEVRAAVPGPVVPGLAVRGSVLVVEAADWASGMGASLRCGLAALERLPVDACVVALVDQPLVTADAVRRLLAAGAELGPARGAAVATYAGAPRNPVLLSRAVWAQVAQAAVGDAGARPWLRAHPDRVASVPCDDTGSPLDVDTAADLADLAHTLETA